MEKLLKPSEVAEVLRVDVALARELMRTMPYINLTGSEEKPRLLVAESDLETWILERKHNTAPMPAERRRKPTSIRVLEGYEADGRLKRRKA